MDLVKSQGAHAVFNHREPGYVDKIQVGDTTNLNYVLFSIKISEFQKGHMAWGSVNQSNIKITLACFYQEFVKNKGVNMIIELVGDVNMDKDVKLLAKFGRIMVSSDHFSCVYHLLECDIH